MSTLRRFTMWSPSGRSGTSSEVSQISAFYSCASPRVTTPPICSIFPHLQSSPSEQLSRSHAQHNDPRKQRQPSLPHPTSLPFAARPASKTRSFTQEMGDIRRANMKESGPTGDAEVREGRDKKAPPGRSNVTIGRTTTSCWPKEEVTYEARSLKKHTQGSSRMLPSPQRLHRLYASAFRSDRLHKKWSTLSRTRLLFTTVRLGPYGR